MKPRSRARAAHGDSTQSKPAAKRRPSGQRKQKVDVIRAHREVSKRQRDLIARHESCKSDLTALCDSFRVLLDDPVVREVLVEEQLDAPPACLAQGTAELRGE